MSENREVTMVLIVHCAYPKKSESFLIFFNDREDGEHVYTCGVIHVDGMAKPIQYHCSN